MQLSLPQTRPSALRSGYTLLAQAYCEKCSTAETNKKNNKPPSPRRNSHEGSSYHCFKLFPFCLTLPPLYLWLTCGKNPAESPLSKQRYALQALATRGFYEHSFPWREGGFHCPAAIFILVDLFSLDFFVCSDEFQIPEFYSNVRYLYDQLKR